MWELTRSFRFEAAHSLANTNLGAAGEEIHGHFVRAEVVIRGTPDRETATLVDLGVLESRLDSVRTSLGHAGVKMRLNALSGRGRTARHG